MIVNINRIGDIMEKMSEKEMVAFIETMALENAALKAKLESKKGNGRKEEVLGLIRELGKVSIKDMAERIGITDRNISSQLSYLRKDGLRFGKDSKGRIYEEKE